MQAIQHIEQRQEKSGGQGAASTKDNLPVLDVERVVRHLINRGILRPSEVVQDGVTVEDLSRRNANFRVLTGNGRGFLVKQEKDKQAMNPDPPILREAYLMRALDYDDALSVARDLAPRFYDFDVTRRVLVTELVHPATSLTKLHLNVGRVTFPAESAQSAAHILATFHRAGARAVRDGHLNALPPGLPLGLSALSEANMRASSSIGPEFIEMLKPLSVPQVVTEATKGWWNHKGLTHGDVRWDNFLLTHGTARGGRLNLRLIDWELCSVGDPLWDIACYIGEYVRFWLILASNNGAAREEDYDRRQVFPLTACSASARTFWESYARARRWSKPKRDRELTRLLPMLPTYFAFIGWELVSNLSKQQTLNDVPAMSRKCVALAAAFEARPRELAREWFGLEAGGDVE